MSSHTAGPDCPDCPDTPLGTIVLVHVSHVNVQRGPAAPVDPILRNPRGKELQRGRLSGDRNLHTRTGGNLKKKGPSSIFNYVLLSVLFPTSFLFLFPPSASWISTGFSHAGREKRWVGGLGRLINGRPMLRTYFMYVRGLYCDAVLYYTHLDTAPIWKGMRATGRLKRKGNSGIFGMEMQKPRDQIGQLRQKREALAGCSFQGQLACVTPAPLPPPCFFLFAVPQYVCPLVTLLAACSPRLPDSSIVYVYVYV